MKVLFGAAGAMLLAGAMFVLPQGAQAQNFPTRPVKVVIGYSPGGAVDILGRVVAQKLGERLGVTVIVENRPGATANVAAEYVANAEPDGYTILLATTSHVMQADDRKLSFDPIKSFAPITQMAAIPNVIMVNPGVPANNLAELTALFAKNPGKYNFASTGIGGATHLAGELYRRASKTDVVHVPYKGAGAAVNAVVGGEVAVYFGSVSAAKSFASTNKLKVLGVTATKRVKALPDVPTTAEAGLPGFIAATWYGYLAPAKTPPAIVRKLRDEIAAVLHSPEFVARLETDGGVPVGETPEEFTKFLQDETQRLAPLVKAMFAEANK